MQTLMQTLKMNMTTVRQPQMNKMIVTHHLRHLSTPINQTINKIYMQHNILLNENKSIP